MQAALSPNERLRHRFHPVTSYVIVPLFALANVGIALDGGFLSEALRSPLTLGIVVGYAVGKPLGVVAGGWLALRLGNGGSGCRSAGARSPARAGRLASASPSRC